jgi:hypothetical protein
MDGRANPLMDLKAVGVVLFGVVVVVTSPPSAGCSVVWCSCRCSCSAVAVAVEEVVVVVVVVVKRRPKSEEIKMASGRKINLQARMDNLIHKPYNNKFANNFRQRRNLRNNTMILH